MYLQYLTISLSSEHTHVYRIFYQITEYDPNPLLSLGKRRRQTSMSTEDKRSSSNSQPSTSTNTNNVLPPVLSTTSCYVSPSDAQSLDRPKVDDVDAKVLEEYRERKRMKKRRRDKLKKLQETQEGKKKHRRRKFCEEHRKHKHRKHRKHKHRHSHHSSHSEGSHIRFVLFRVKLWYIGLIFYFFDI